MRPHLRRAELNGIAVLGEASAVGGTPLARSGPRESKPRRKVAAGVLPSRREEHGRGSPLGPKITKVSLIVAFLRIETATFGGAFKARRGERMPSVFPSARLSVILRGDGHANAAIADCLRGSAACLALGAGSALRMILRP